MKKKVLVIMVLILCCICSTGCKTGHKTTIIWLDDTSVSTYEITKEEVDYFEDSATTWDDIDQELDSVWVSPEYLEELEYNSKSNVYPEGMD